MDAGQTQRAVISEEEADALMRSTADELINAYCLPLLREMGRGANNLGKSIRLSLKVTPGETDVDVDFEVGEPEDG